MVPLLYPLAVSVAGAVGWEFANDSLPTWLGGDGAAGSEDSAVSVFTPRNVALVVVAAAGAVYLFKSAKGVR